ncbi:MAG TPA: phosphoribosylamine--glycine ligase [Actinomycetota bacterium]|nr:phosphoribosylamine--glycine ligase [Actinomycetota bacterium]
MRALVVGGGGREHAVVWAMAKSPLITDLHCAPGNPGIAELANCHPVSPTDIPALCELAVRVDAGLVVIGPEAPLAAGLGDALRQLGVRVFGPGAEGAKLESSKSFAKGLMVDAGIPTASARAFDRVDDAVAYVRATDQPVVIKADGLAAGKGVTVCRDSAEAESAIVEAMSRLRFGDAGRRILVEERMEGQELSILALCDGKTVVALPEAQDFKRAYDGDTGPNTGGMGSYSPVPVCSPDLFRQAVEEVLEPAAEAMGRFTEPYVGVIYAGLMVTDQGLKVVEFNCRFGDPEIQAIIPRMTSDFGEAILACTEGSLSGVRLTFTEDACVCVVAASAGYPESERLTTGFPIHGADLITEGGDVQIFHAGTALREGRLVSSGGRVLGVSALGFDLGTARKRAYEVLSTISFEGMRYRTDIASRAVQGFGGTEPVSRMWKESEWI